MSIGCVLVRRFYVSECTETWQGNMQREIEKMSEIFRGSLVLAFANRTIRRWDDRHMTVWRRCFRRFGRGRIIFRHRHRRRLEGVRTKERKDRRDGRTTQLNHTWQKNIIANLDPGSLQTRSDVSQLS